MAHRADQTPDLSFGDFTIHRSDERVRGPAGPLKLGHKAYCVLLSLAERQGTLVTKDELFATVWDGTIVSESALTSAVKELRRALDDDRSAPRYIESVYGRGYRLLSPVTVGGRTPAHDAGAGAASPAAAPPRSVAVLPFANLTGDPSNDYLCDGTAEELINALTHLSGLKVPARTSSFAYRGRELDVREIARQLGVAAVVEGSVRTAGDRIRLTVQLIDSASGFHIWSENFDRSLGDLLDLQDELARAVAGALGRELRLAARATGDPEAMRLHLQARSMAGRLTDEGVTGAEAVLRRAIALDPGFARAREGLAGTLLVAMSIGAKPFETCEEARQEAELALGSDPDLAGARSILACLDALRGDWTGAERNFVAALELSDGDSVIHEAFAYYVLLPAGRHERARAHAERAFELAPARGPVSLLRAFVEWLRGDAAAASAHLDTAVMLGVSGQLGNLRLLRAGCMVFQGLLDEAGAEAASALPPFARAAGGEEAVRQVYRAIGGAADLADARAGIAALFEACRTDERFWRDPVLPSYLLGCQASLGDLDGAYRLTGLLIERWRSTGHLPVHIFTQMWMPLMASFRADPRFQDLVGEIGLLRYWAGAGAPDGYALEGGRLVRAQPPALVLPAEPRPGSGSKTG